MLDPLRLSQHARLPLGQVGSRPVDSLLQLQKHNKMKQETLAERSAGIQVLNIKLELLSAGSYLEFLISI